MNYPTIAQAQAYFRKAYKLEGKGSFLQTALFEGLDQLGEVFDNLRVTTGLYMQDQPLTQQQWTEIRRHEALIIARAKELVADYEARIYLETQGRGITRQELIHERIEEMRAKSEGISYDLKRIFGE